MDVTLKQQSWNPIVILSKEEVVKEYTNMCDMIDDVMMYIDAYSYMTEATGDSQPTQNEKDGLFTRIGKKIVAVLNRLVRWINNLIGNKAMEDMDNTEKLDAICKKYPVLKERVVMMVSEGLLDLSAVKSMNEFIEAYGEVDKWADPSNMSALDKIVQTGKKFINTSSLNITGVMSAMMTITSFYTSVKKFKDMLGDIKKWFNNKFNGEAVQKSFNIFNDILGRGNKKNKNSNNQNDDADSDDDSQDSQNDNPKNNGNNNNQNGNPKNNGNKNNQNDKPKNNGNKNNQNDKPKNNGNNNNQNGNPKNNGNKNNQNDKPKNNGNNNNQNGKDGSTVTEATENENFFDTARKKFTELQAATIEFSKKVIDWIDARYKSISRITKKLIDTLVELVGKIKKHGSFDKFEKAVKDGDEDLPANVKYENGKIIIDTDYIIKDVVGVTEDDEDNSSRIEDKSGKGNRIEDKSGSKNESRSIKKKNDSDNGEEGDDNES